MKEIVIVYGPPMSGKTLNKEILAEHFKCDAVFDGVEGNKVFEYSGRCLVLSNQPKVSGMEVNGAEIVHVERVKELIGDAWREPSLIHFSPNTQDCRDCEKAATLAGELIAMIRVNALRGTFATATFEEIEDHLKPWIARLMEIRHRPIIPAIRETNDQGLATEGAEKRS